MSLLAAVPLALLGLTVAAWCPLLGVICGYAAGLLVRFDVRASDNERYTARHDTD
jgi:hypothetical protein